MRFQDTFSSERIIVSKKICKLFIHFFLTKLGQNLATILITLSKFMSLNYSQMYAPTPMIYFLKLSMRSMHYRRFLASSKTIKTPISKDL